MTSIRYNSCVTRRTFAAGIGAAGIVAGTAPFNIGRAQGVPLKVGVLLPRSGVLAGLGQECQRGVDVASGLLKDMGLPNLQLMNADTESDIQIARAQAEKLINEGAHLLVGAYGSGTSSAIAQVAEQRGIPLVINVAAAPQITEQGYKFVFRNFPTAVTILPDCFALQNEVFVDAGRAPKTVALLYTNDTFGNAMLTGIGSVVQKIPMPYKIVETIAYDPKARDLSIEVAKAKGTGAEALLVVGWLNDAILLTRELVKQRWEGMGVLSLGGGWYEDQYMKALGKLSDGPISFGPWHDPNKKLAKAMLAAFAKAFPESNLSTNPVYTFEALLVAADAYKRAGSTDPKALAEAIRKTYIKDNVSQGPGIQFNEKGQNDKLRCAAVQNRGGKHITVAPTGATDGKVDWPAPPYTKRS